MRILYDILNEDTLAVFDYQWEGIPQQANETNFSLKLKVEILSSKRDLHELLDHQAEDLGNIVHTVMAAAYKRCKHCFNEEEECSKTLLRQSFTLTTRFRIVLLGIN